MLFPATELSEQISTAGMEASGTGCMKAVMNGGVIIGTLDGANIEIRADVESENMFVFGKTAEEVSNMRAGGYDPRAYIAADPELARVIETIGSLGGGIYQPLVDALRQNDRYFLCADFRSYVETQQRAAEAWLARDQWTRMSIMNTARSAYFSADRTVAEYARDIWHAEPVPVDLVNSSSTPPLR
jgi:starch phosphorylase